MRITHPLHTLEVPATVHREFLLCLSCEKAELFGQDVTKSYRKASNMPALRRDLLSATILLWLAFATAVQPEHAPSSHVLFNIKHYGGARAAVGADRMRSVRQNSGLERRSLESLFQQLDEEDQLVIPKLLQYDTYNMIPEGDVHICRLNGCRMQAGSWEFQFYFQLINVQLSARNLRALFGSAKHVSLFVCTSHVQGIDLNDNILVYSCKKPVEDGTHATGQGFAAADAPAEPASADSAGQTATAPAAGADPAVRTGTAGHHHRRQLLQEADSPPEWNCTWLVSAFIMAAAATTRVCYVLLPAVRSNFTRQMSNSPQKP